MLPELTGTALAVNPNKIAIVFQDQKMTYGELDQHVQGIANTLGYNGGKKIAIIAKNSLNSFALYLACRRSNNVAVMISWKLPMATQNRLIEECGVDSVFRDADLETLTLTEGPLRYECDANAHAMFLFTSGSTGEPKAAVITNGNRQTVMHRLPALPAINLRIVPTPFYHINAINIAEHCLSNMGTAIIMAEFEATEYIELVMKFKVSNLSLIPSFMAMILNCPEINNYNFGFVYHITIATGATTQTLYERIKKIFSNARITIGYGLTEFGSAFGPAPAELNLPIPQMSCGYPQTGVECKLVDGVLHLKSASMSSGYYNSADSKIVDGWLNTGDLFRVDENGFYFFMGRADDMYKVGSEQVYPSEIEEALEQVSGITQACVVMLEDDVKGFKPYAFCAGTFDETSVLTALTESLPRYKVPRKVWHIEEFPYIGVGKIDRKTLAERANELL